MRRLTYRIRRLASLMLALIGLISGIAAPGYLGHQDFSSRPSALAFAIDADYSNLAPQSGLESIANGDARASVSPLLESAQSAQAPMDASYGKLPLSFEANQGQTDSQVNFISRGGGYTLFLTPTEAVMSLQVADCQPEDEKSMITQLKPKLRAHGNKKSAVLRMKFVGANRAPQVEGVDQLPGKSNYLIGDPARWHTNIPRYARVSYKDVFPGVSLIYYGNQGRIEYDFVIAAGADPGAIRIAFEGEQGMRLDSHGDLVLRTPAGIIRQSKPFAYQEVAGVNKEIPGRYVINQRHEISFDLAEYDTSKPLVIDPMIPSLVYSTYLGGSGDDTASAIKIDNAGNAYVAGFTSSPDFPLAGSGMIYKGGQEGFVTKLNSAGNSLLYSTYIGGSSDDAAYGIAVGSDGNAYVSGVTSSSDFPTTPGAYKRIYGGGQDVFVARLNSSGSDFLYSTYLGGSGDDIGTSIALDSSSNAYVTGATKSSNFTITPLAIQKVYGGGGYDAFVTKIFGGGYALHYSTYLGGSGDDVGSGIATDTSGNAYVTGSTSSSNFPTTPGALGRTLGGGNDCYVTKINSSGTSYNYSTYIGGGGNDGGVSIVTDSTSIAYVTGSTTSTNFPTSSNAISRTLNGPQDAFVARVDGGALSLIYSTYLGGSGSERGYGIAHWIGNTYVTGFTNSSNFPTAIGTIDSSYNGGKDAFITAIDGSGHLGFSSYFGGSGDEEGRGITVTLATVYVTGLTKSSNFPTSSGAFSRTLKGAQDGFVAKMNTN